MLIAISSNNKLLFSFFSFPYRKNICLFTELCIIILGQIPRTYTRICEDTKSMYQLTKTKTRFNKHVLNLYLRIAKLY